MNAGFCLKVAGTTVRVGAGRLQAVHVEMRKVTGGGGAVERHWSAGAVVTTNEAMDSPGNGGTVGKVFPHAESVLGLLANAGRQMTFEVTGTSMEPLLTPGDRVTVQPVCGDRLKRGNVIAFVSGGQVVVHRLIGKRRRSGTMFYRESGDNTGTWTWIREEALIGRVVSFDGRGGRADMEDALWKWANPVLGTFRAGRFACEAFLRRVKAAVIGDGPWGGRTSLLRGAAATVFFPPAGRVFRRLLARFGRRRLPEVTS